jgi:hypothetical protein
LPSGCSNFLGWLTRNVNVIYIKDYANSVNNLFCLKITFLFWNHLINFKDHIHSSLIIVKKSWDVILKVFLLS